MMNQTMILEDGTEMEMVHFAFRALDGERIACAPKLVALASVPERGFAFRRSPDPRAVTCPLCREMTPFKEADVALDIGLRSNRRVT